MFSYFLISLIQEFKNYEDLGLKSFLASLCLILMFAIVYLYVSKDKKLKEQSGKYQKLLDAKDVEIKDRDKSISDLQNTRIEDLKKFTEKYQTMAEKNFTHVQQLTDLVRNT